MNEYVYEPFVFLLLDPHKIGSTVDIPSDLSELVEATKHIKRGQSKKYPPGMIVDHDYAHLHRLVKWGASLDLDGVDKEKLIRTLWVHDLPEIEVGDLASVDKYEDPAAAEKRNLSEFEVAQRILNDEDYELFVQFEHAKNILEKKVVATELPPGYAFVARILDIIDGNLGTYWFYNLWLESKNFDPEYYFSDDISTYGLRQYRLYKGGLESVSIDESIKVTCLELFRQEFLCRITLLEENDRKKLTDLYVEEVEKMRELI